MRTNALVLLHFLLEDAQDPQTRGGDLRADTVAGDDCDSQARAFRLVK